MLVIAIIVLQYSGFGRYVYVIGNKQEVARYSGVKVERTKMILFVASATIAAMAGLLYAARLGAVRGDIANGFELDIITMVLLGGVSIFGGTGYVVGCSALHLDHSQSAQRHVAGQYVRPHADRRDRRLADPLCACSEPGRQRASHLAPAPGCQHASRSQYPTIGGLSLALSIRLAQYQARLLYAVRMQQPPTQQEKTMKKFRFVLPLLIIAALMLSACAPAAAPAAPAAPGRPPKPLPPPKHPPPKPPLPPKPAAEEAAPATEAAATEPAAEEAAPAAGDVVKAEPGKAVKMVLMPKFLGILVFDQANTGAQEAANELGNPEKLEFLGPTPENSVAGQIEIVTNAATQGVQAIMISNNAGDQIAPAAKAARDAGMTVVTWDSPIPSAEGEQLFVAQVDFAETGKVMADMALNILGEEGGKFAILSASPDAANQNAWIASMQEALKDPKYSKLELLDIVYGNDQSEDSYNQALALVDKYPDMKLIMSPTSVGIVAAAKAMQDEGLCEKVKVSGLGLPAEMVAYTLNGCAPEFALWSFVDLGYRPTMRPT